MMRTDTIFFSTKMATSGSPAHMVPTSEMTIQKFFTTIQPLSLPESDLLMRSSQQWQIVHSFVAIHQCPIRQADNLRDNSLHYILFALF